MVDRMPPEGIPSQPPETARPAPPPQPPTMQPTDPGVLPVDDTSARAATSKDIAEMETAYQKEIGIAGIRPEAMARLGFSPQMLWDMFNAVSNRVEPMDVGDLILGAATQGVPIIKGKLETVYRITGGRHDDLIARATSKKRAAAIKRVRDMGADPDDVGVDYDEVRFACELMLSCAVAKVGSRNLPDPIEADSMDDQDKTLQQNLAIISGVKGHAFWLLWVNFVWFQYRVRKAISEEVVKNG